MRCPPCPVRPRPSGGFREEKGQRKEEKGGLGHKEEWRMVCPEGRNREDQEQGVAGGMVSWQLVS